MAARSRRGLSESRKLRKGRGSRAGKVRAKAFGIDMQLRQEEEPRVSRLDFDEAS